MLLVIGHLIAEILGQHPAMETQAVVLAEPRQRELIAARMRNQAGTRIAGENRSRRLSVLKTGATERARRVTELMAIKLDPRA